LINGPRAPHTSTQDRAYRENPEFPVGLSATAVE